MFGRRAQKCAENEENTHRHEWPLKCTGAGMRIKDAARRRLLREVIPWYNLGMKIALSIPDELFASADVLARRLGVSRSRLYASAVQDFVAKHKAKNVTERLNAVYASQDSSLDETFRQLQARSLEKNTW